MLAFRILTGVIFKSWYQHTYRCSQNSGVGAGGLQGNVSPKTFPFSSKVMFSLFVVYVYTCNFSLWIVYEIQSTMKSFYFEIQCRLIWFRQTCARTDHVRLGACFTWKPDSAGSTSVMDASWQQWLPRNSMFDYEVFALRHVGAVNSLIISGRVPSLVILLSRHFVPRAWNAWWIWQAMEFIEIEADGKEWVKGRARRLRERLASSRVVLNRVFFVDLQLLFRLMSVLPRAVMVWKEEVKTCNYNRSMSAAGLLYLDTGLLFNQCLTEKIWFIISN
jgi:hypothetical protein